MRFLRQSLLGVFLASVTLGLVFYAAQLVTEAIQTQIADEKRPAQDREREFAVSVRIAELEEIAPELRAFGQIKSRRTLELRSAVGGRVIELSEDFVEGGTVSEAEVLVRIDPADAQAAFERATSDELDARAEGRDARRALDLARDELTAAQDQADLRRRALQRQEDLAERGVGTAANTETAELAAAAARQAVLARRMSVAQTEARVDQAATRLARAQIAVDEARRELADTTVVAGFDGTLSGVNLVEGRLVAANEKLAELVDPNALEVAFRVSTAQYTRLLAEEGRLISAPVSISLDNLEAEVQAQGTISRDGVAAGEGQSGRLLFARLDGATGFKPDDFVTVTVLEPALQNVARLPASALDASGTVLVLGTEDRLEAIPVTLLRRQGDDVLITGDGLDGREVVISRTPLLGSGIRVRPVRTDAQSDAQSGAPSMLELSDDHRARLVAFVEGNKRMPSEMKSRVLNQLAQARVPASLVERIESRMGG